MLKDTKSLGNNKASAFGAFVIKNEGMHFDTPSSLFVAHKNNLQSQVYKNTNTIEINKKRKKNFTSQYCKTE